LMRNGRFSGLAAVKKKREFLSWKPRFLGKERLKVLAEAIAIRACPISKP
jgi:hypothetical protein